MVKQIIFKKRHEAGFHKAPNTVLNPTSLGVLALADQRRSKLSDKVIDVLTNRVVLESKRLIWQTISEVQTPDQRTLYLALHHKNKRVVYFEGEENGTFIYPLGPIGELRGFFTHTSNHVFAFNMCHAFDLIEGEHFILPSQTTEIVQPYLTHQISRVGGKVLIILSKHIYDLETMEIVAERKGDDLMPLCARIIEKDGKLQTFNFGYLAPLGEPYSNGIPFPQGLDPRGIDLLGEVFFRSKNILLDTNAVPTFEVILSIEDRLEPLERRDILTTSKDGILVAYRQENHTIYTGTIEDSV